MNQLTHRLYLMPFADRLATLRKQRGLTQEARSDQDLFTGLNQLCPVVGLDHQYTDRIVIIRSGA